MNLGIYIHLPYCLTKCPYCDFNSYGVGTEFPEEEYTQAILSEIDIRGNLLKNGKVSSVFFGGGTPSLFKPSNINTILEKLNSKFEIDKSAEITLEINPRTVELEKLKQFLDAGVNRASIGIQSFSERKLKFYGRNSTSKDGKKVLEDVINAGFKNFNIDLIYGSSNETIDELKNDLEISLQFGSTHLSAYCLTIEDGTQFGYLYKKGMLKLPEDRVLSDMYFLTSEVLEKNGFFHYEISNFTKPGNQCVQNLIYWNCDTYIGFGAGAHSHLKGYGVSGDWGKRWGNIKTPGMYMKKTAKNETPSEFVETLERESSLCDWVMMGLRLSGGIEMNIMKRIYNADLDYNKIEYLFDDGMLHMNNGYLNITRKGRIYSNLLIGKVTDSVNFLI